VPEIQSGGRAGEENSNEDTYKSERENMPGINKEFEDAYELKKQSLSKLDMFKLLNDTFESDRAIKLFRSRMGEASVGRRLIISDNGYVGIVPPDTERRNLIRILFGGRLPFILRAVEMAAIIL
jgi:hypothetical protein